MNHDWEFNMRKFNVPIAEIEDEQIKCYLCEIYVPIDSPSVLLVYNEDNGSYSAPKICIECNIKKRDTLNSDFNSWTSLKE